MRMSARRVRAIFRKELREYRRNRRIVVSMAVLPLLFSVYPSIEIFALPASASGVLLHRQPLVYMLAIPAIVPATVAAYSVAGERQPAVASALLTGPELLAQLLFTPSWPPCRSGDASPSRPGRTTPGSPPSSACSPALP